MNTIFAIIPWSEASAQDRMFIIDDPTKNVDHRNEPFLEMKQTIEKNGDVIHTVDYFEDLGRVDFFLFFELNWDWVYKIICHGFANRMVYCNAEPPSVNPLNSKEGFEKLGRIFPIILTWNDEWINNKNIFKRNIPYYFVDERAQVAFSGKKLLTSISGNKKSKFPDELYSEREKVISFFEKNYPDQFEFYGTGWDNRIHPAYKGRVDNKAETFHHYKFAICFENVKNLSGYVTEKILNCITSGIVPIYAGAKDIDKYVYPGCYIDYWAFRNCKELADFLLNMSEEEYQSYLNEADRFLHSADLDAFKGERYAQYIYKAIDHKIEFSVSVMTRINIWYIVTRQSVVRKIKNVVFKNNI